MAIQASVDDNGFAITWDLNTMVPKWTVHLDGKGLRSVVFSPDGHSLLCSTHGCFYVFDLEDGSIRYESNGLELYEEAIFINEGDKILVPTAFGTIYEYPLPSLRELMDRMGVLISRCPSLSNEEKRVFYLED